MTDVETVAPEYLRDAVRALAERKHRLVQMHGRRAVVGVHDGVEITYTFDKDMTLHHLRVLLPHGCELDSVSELYASAFLYENEIKDLFGVPFHNLTVDYHGEFYRTAQKTPMNGSEESSHG